MAKKVKKFIRKATKMDEEKIYLDRRGKIDCRFLGSEHHHMRNHALTVLIAGLLFMVPCFAQDSSPAFILSGQVILDTGQPPQEPVQVVLTCSGVVYQQVLSQSGGQFSFNLVDNKTPGTDFFHTAGSPSGGGFKNFNQLGRGMGDSGAWGSGRSKGGRLSLSDCEVSAVLPGYISEVIYPGSRDRMDNPDLGTITLYPIQRPTSSVVSVELLAAPKKAREAYEKAQSALAKGQVKDAKKNLQIAVEHHPSFSMAWQQLGQIAASEGNRQQAKEHFEAAIKADQSQETAYCALAQLLLAENQEALAQAHLEEVLSRQSKAGCAAYLYAYTSFQRGDLARAEEYARKVLEGPQSQSFPGAYYLLGSILAQKRNYSDAASQFKRFLQLSPGSVEVKRIRAKLSAWQKMGLLEDGSDSIQ